MAGCGANPYDTEPEDIDLFAMIGAGLSALQICHVIRPFDRYRAKISGGRNRLKQLGCGGKI